MVRLRDRDDLQDLQGRAGDAFRAATLTTLQNAFLSAAAPAEKEAARDALRQFQQAARKLRISENAFNTRARPSGPRPNLLGYMRSPAQFAAMRAFSSAKENLLGINPAVGQNIVRLVAQQAFKKGNNVAPQQTRSYGRNVII